MPILKNNDAELYYEVHGSLSQPCLLMLNGFTRPMTDFRSFVKFLQEHNHTCLLLDNRGSGKSVVFDKVTLEIMANDVICLLNHLGLHETNILGISMGGMILQEVLSRHPERLLKKILVSTTASSTSIQKVHFTTNYDDNVEKMKKYFSESYLKRNQLLVRALTKQVTAQVESKNASAQAKAIGQFDFTDVLLRYKQPEIKFIHGKEDAIIPPASQQLLSRQNPNISMDLVDGCGHLLLAEAPKKLYQSTLDFLMH